MFRLVGVGLVVGALHVCWAAEATAPSTLTASQAVQIALLNRAELDAAKEARVATDGALRQAGLRPNPVLSVQTENWRAWGDPSLSLGRDMDLFASVSRRIEIGGKRIARRDLARAGQATADVERKALAWQIRAQVLQAFESALSAERERALIAASTQRYVELERYERTRLDEGAAAEIDVIKVRIEREKAELRLAEAEAHAAAAQLALLKLMGVRRGPGLRLIDEAPAGLETAMPDLDAARDWARAFHPHLLLARARAEQAGAAVSVEQSKAKPDVTPYFGYKRNGPFNSLIGGVSVPLPVSNRNQGEIQSATAEQRRQEAFVRAAESIVLAEIEAAAEAWRRHAAIAQSVSAGPVRQAKEARAIAFAAYQEQAVNLLFLLDAQRTETEAALLEAKAIAQYRTSRREFEAAVGKPLQGEAR